MEKRGKRWIWWVGGATVLLIVIGISTARRAGRAMPVTVEAAPLQGARIVASVAGTGTLEAADFVDLRAGTSGLVDKVLVKAGDVVKGGQPLVSMSARLAQSQFDQARASVDLARSRLNQFLTRSSNSNDTASLQQKQAEAQLKSARARLDELEKGPSTTAITQSESAYKQAVLNRQEAEADYARMKDLFDQGAVPRAQLEAAKARLESAQSQEEAARQQLATVKAGPTEAELSAARSQVSQAEAALELAQIAVASRDDEESAARATLRQAEAQLASAKEDLENAVIRSPMAGQVLSVQAQEGATVAPGQMLVTVGRPGGLIARVKVDEMDVVQIREGQKALINSDALADRSFSGSVTFVAPQGINAGAGGSTFEVEVAVEESGTALRPGMTVDVEIEVDSRQAKTAVPLLAVIEEESNGQRGRYVYVVRDSVAHRVPIELGLSNDTMAEVISGVEPQDLVVTGDYEAFKKLTDGAPVLVKGQPSRKEGVSGLRGRRILRRGNN